LGWPEKVVFDLILEHFHRRRGRRRVSGERDRRQKAQTREKTRPAHGIF